MPYGQETDQAHSTVCGNHTGLYYTKEIIALLYFCCK